MAEVALSDPYLLEPSKLEVPALKEYIALPSQFAPFESYRSWTGWNPSPRPHFAH